MSRAQLTGLVGLGLRIAKVPLRTFLSTVQTLAETADQNRLLWELPPAGLSYTIWYSIIGSSVLQIRRRVLAPCLTTRF
jgi:hypothetical protein